jgi:ABC-type enterochelin transport system substrate-binding protein
MIGVIPNPKKSFQVEKPVAEIKQAIEHLTLFTTKYKLFKANPTLNQYTFEASEFLSLGVYIDISYFTIADSRTEVTIEIRRKIGSFDKSHEVSLANTHLTTITDLISESISTDPAERLAKLEQIEADKKHKEDELKEKIEENKRKAQEEKENNPLLYYTKQTVLILLSIGLIGGTIFMLYKFFTK